MQKNTANFFQQKHKNTKKQKKQKLQITNFRIPQFQKFFAKFIDTKNRPQNKKNNFTQKNQSTNFCAKKPTIFQMTFFIWKIQTIVK